MRVLIIKTSSFGDIIHTFPALSDALRTLPEVRFDWLIDEQYTEIALLHPAVDNAIATQCKQWLKNLLLPWRRTDDQWRIARTTLTQNYDVVVDLQGLMRVAWLLSYTPNTCIGYDWRSVREPLASLWYDIKVAVSTDWHAVERSRQLLAVALGYTDRLGDYANRQLPCEYHITPSPLITQSIPQPTAQLTILFAHGSRWMTKLWPLHHWQTLARLCIEHGFAVCVPYGTDTEYERAQQIVATDSTNIRLLHKCSGAALVHVIAAMDGVVSVDSALTHIAAAVSVPNVCLFGATSPRLTRPYGDTQSTINSHYRCAPCLSKRCRIRPATNTPPPCMDDITPAQVFAQLQLQLQQ